MIKKNIQTLLIANRGEIASRIIQTTKKMGIRTIAIYAQDDKDSLFVHQADEAYLLEGNTLQDTYLNQDKIIDIAKSKRIDAIHPGYGFLAENADFAQKTIDSGICFIGPQPHTILQMGSKHEAKNLAKKANIPLLPGYHENNQDLDFLYDMAQNIGFPLLIKASAGGGGKGMCVVNSPENFIEDIRATKRISLSSFGNDHVILEKYLAKPRHIEVQILCDTYGNCWVLGQRDCSLQRRYQKIIEEAPASFLTKTLKQNIEACSQELAQKIGYIGAGTIEYLVEDGCFYFMEMNTRLQVEHRVTEKIFDIDLVAWQIKIAQGEKLPKSAPIAKGVSIECRLYAEKPEENFMPSIGYIPYAYLPGEKANLLIDSSITAPMKVTPNYDPMLAKFISWGPTREEAINILKTALKNTKICGIQTNKKFLIDLLSLDAFHNETFHTKSIESEFTHLLQKKTQATLQKQLHYAAIHICYPRPYHNNNIWTSGWRQNDYPRKIFSCLFKQKIHNFTVVDNDAEFWVIDQGKKYIYQKSDTVLIDSYMNNDALHVFFPCGDDINITTNIHSFFDNMHSKATDNASSAPLPGRVTKIFIQSGSKVKAGDPLLIIEAMKMEHKVSAPTSGTVTNLLCQLHDVVEEGAQLFELKPEEEHAA